MAAINDTPRSSAVGASAGGVQALTTMMGSLPADLPVAIVVVHFQLFDESSE